MGALRIAVITAHTSPLDSPGGNKAGGLNVYVLEPARVLVRRGCLVDMFSRQTSAATLEVTEIEPGLRAIHLPAGPVRSLAPETVHEYLPEFEASLLSFAARENLQYDLIHSHYWLSGL